MLPQEAKPTSKNTGIQGRAVANGSDLAQFGDIQSLCERLRLAGFGEEDIRRILEAAEQAQGFVRPSDRPTVWCANVCLIGTIDAGSHLHLLRSIRKCAVPRLVTRHSSLVTQDEDAGGELRSSGASAGFEFRGSRFSTVYRNGRPSRKRQVNS